jgi:hypothetical protein
MNIPRDKAIRHCQALAEIHQIVRDSFTTTSQDAWDDITHLFERYFQAIEASPPERAELGL